MKSVFEASEFVFPYRDVKFPGQASDERILYVTREALAMLYARVLMMMVAGLVLGGSGWWLGSLARGYGLSQEMATGVQWGSVGLGMMFAMLGSWWVWILWRKSLFILTTRRLTKFVHATPWNRYHLSLGLDQVVDTGSYARGYLKAWLRIGMMTARSAAGNRAEKYFYVENIEAVEDLANYVNKLLYHFNREEERLEKFRPFVPFLKGGKRKKFMEQYPEFWS